MNTQYSEYIDRLTESERANSDQKIVNTNAKVKSKKKSKILEIDSKRAELALKRELAGYDL